jgi:hypothetical protein
MKHLLPTFVCLTLAACSQAGSDQNPRDRKGVEGALTWRAVNQADSQAAFLSRPGAAPDVVLWCRDDAKIVLRAHVFETPAPQPDLSLTTKGGMMVFADVRRQGGVRAGDRKLVEGSASLMDPKVQAVLTAADQFVLQTGEDKYQVQDSDPNGILVPFITNCSQPNPPKE